MAPEKEDPPAADPENGKPAQDGVSAGEDAKPKRRGARSSGEGGTRREGRRARKAAEKTPSETG